MKYINLFETFGNKDISAIENFLKFLSDEDSDKFIDTLKLISTHTDIPLSNFKGDYIKAISAIKMNSEEDKLIKFWFSIKDGITGITTTKNFTEERKIQHEEDYIAEWMDTAFIQNFIINNLLVNSHLSEIYWTKNRYEKIITSEFALVVNITSLSKGLNNLKTKRNLDKKGALSFYNNDYIRLNNQKK